MVRLLSVFAVVCGVPAAMLTVWAFICVMNYVVRRVGRRPVSGWSNLTERALVFSGLMLFATFFWSAIAYGAYVIGLPW